MQQKTGNQKYFYGQQQKDKTIQQHLKEQTEKVQYFKLVFQLQEQKKLICQQKIQSLRQEVYQKTNQNQQLKSKLLKLNKKYDKLKQKQRQRQDSFQSNKKHINQNSKNQIQSFQQNNNCGRQQSICPRCAQFQFLETQLYQQRELYSSDRILFKNQIYKLKQELQNAQQLIQDKSTQNTLNAQLRLTQKLKKELILCYNKIQNQLNLIQLLNQNISNFQIQYTHLLEIVKKLQIKYKQHLENKLIKNQKNYEPNKDHQMNKNDRKLVNNKTTQKYEVCFTHRNIQNKRRCGSIKRIQNKLDHEIFFMQKDEAWNK